jgi:hypothetical protein
MKQPHNMKTVTRSQTAPNQLGDADLASDGMRNGSSQPARAQGHAGNQYSGVQDPNKTINKGRGPTRGNTGDLAGRSCTPPTSAVPGLPAQGSVRDSINRGGQVRNPGGTRSFEPSATQNYRGNPDSINMGRGPTRGNQC